jgi:tape measure domain-containing protein
MNTVDNRVVNMGFDNQQFERGVQTSVKSLETLKKGLNLDESARSLTNISNIGKSFSLEGISTGVERISSGFSTMGIIGITALMNLTNMVMDLGKKAVTAALGIDEMRNGFASYEVKTNAVKTVMAGTGESITEVNKNLDDLNKYSDRTVYSFQDMTENISKFTNAGLSSKDAATAIMGISNVAAISGASTQEAARAMYNFGQAMQQGSVRLMDWKSIENANMATVGFKQTLIDTAIAQGTLKKATDGTIRTLKGEVLSATKNFNGSLEQEWLTVGVLNKTLADYASTETEIGKKANAAATEVSTFTQMMAVAQDSLKTGWTKTWQLVFGDLFEAKALFTSISTAMGTFISSAADARNGLLQGWKDMGGQQAMVYGLQFAIAALVQVMDTVKKAFAEIFPPLTAQMLFDVSNNFRLFALGLQQSAATSEKLKSAFKGVFAVFDLVGRAIGTLVERLAKLAGPLLPKGNGGILDFLANLGDSIVKFRDWMIATDGFNRALDAIGAYLTEAKDKFLYFSQTVKLAFDNFKAAVSANPAFIAISNTLRTFAGVILLAFNAIKGIDFRGIFGSIGDAISSFANSIASTGIFGTIGKIFTDVVKSIGDFFEKIKKTDFSGISSFGDKVKERFGPLSKIGDFLGGIFQAFLPKFKEFQTTLANIGDTVGKVFGGLVDSILKWLSSIDFSKINYNQVFDSINAGLISALILSIRGFVQKGGSVFDGIKDVFKTFKGIGDSAKGSFDGIKGILTEVKDTLKTWQESLRADILLKIAGAIGILALSLIALTFVDSGKLTVALAGITGLFADLLGSLALYEKVSGGAGLKSSVGLSGVLISLAASIAILSVSLLILSNIKQEDLNKGLSAVTAMVLLVVTAAEILSKNSGGLVKTAIGLTAFSGALLLLTGVVFLLGNIDDKKLVKGLASVAVLMTLILVSSVVLSKASSGLLKASVGVAAFSVSLLLLSGVVKVLGMIDDKELAKGVFTLAALVAIVSIAATALSKTSGKMLATDIGLVAFSGSLVLFANVVKSFAKMSWDELARGMTGMAASLLIIAGAMRLMPKDMTFTAAALVIVGGALLLISDAVVKMGAMSWEQIAKGLVALGGAMAILVISLNLMTGTLAGSAALLVAALALAVLTPVLMTLGSMGLEGIGIALLALAGVFIVLGVAGLVMGPVIPILMGLGLVMILLGGACIAVGIGMLAFSTALAALAVTGAAGSLALVAIVTNLLTLIPMIAQKLAEGVVAFAQIIANSAPSLANSLLTVLMTLLGTINAIVPQFVMTVLNLVTTLLQALASKLPEIIQAGFSMLIALLQGIADNIYQVVTTAIDIVVKFMEAIASRLPDVIDAGWKLIISFIDGLTKSVDANMPTLIKSCVKLGEAIVTGTIQGLVGGAEMINQTVIKVANEALAAMKAALGIRSPSKKFGEIGMDSMEGLDRGLRRHGGAVSDTMSDIGTTAVASFGRAVAKAADNFDGGVDLSPSIRPVVDLTDVIAGNKQINDLLGDKSLSVASSVNASSAVSANMSPSSGDIAAANSASSQTAAVSFTQNNYSPVALSRIDIYRDTKNQLLTLKGLA